MLKYLYKINIIKSAKISYTNKMSLSDSDRTLIELKHQNDLFAFKHIKINTYTLGHGFLVHVRICLRIKL